MTFSRGPSSFKLQVEDSTVPGDATGTLHVSLLAAARACATSDVAPDLQLIPLVFSILHKTIAKQQFYVEMRLQIGSSPSYRGHPFRISVFQFITHGITFVISTANGKQDGIPGRGALSRSNLNSLLDYASSCVCIVRGNYYSFYTFATYSV